MVAVEDFEGMTMTNQPRMLVLSEQLKTILGQHQELEASIAAEQNARFPDQDAIRNFKKRKLQMKDEMERLAAELPASSYTLINAGLYPLTDAELANKLSVAKKQLRRAMQSKNPTSSEVSKLEANIRTIELEIDRREWDRIMKDSSEEQIEMPLVMASG